MKSLYIVYKVAPTLVLYFLLVNSVTKAQNSPVTHKDLIHVLEDSFEENHSGSKRVHLPMQNNAVVYQFTSPMDSSLSKERIYKAALNWYYKNFPYGRSMLIQSDLKEGQILARGEFQFPYTNLMEELKMKVQYMMSLSLRYGKYRIRFFEIEPQDQILEENDYGKTYSHFEPRNLKIMYEQYLQTDQPPSYMQEKMEGIHYYFQNLIQNFSKSMKSWTHIRSGQGF